MVRRAGEVEADPIDRDEQLGEAIEAYLALTEAGTAPDPSSFASGYPGLEDDLTAALGGLALVQGLVGDPGGPGRRLESGRRVAGYRIVRELGRGGMGIVYEAVHVGLDRPVALKVLGSTAAPDSSGRRRFLNEARTAAGLHHTHIVPVFDVGQVGGLCYYAMQRIEGSGLDRVIRHLRRDRPVAAGSTYPGRTPSRPTPSATAGALTATWGPLTGGPSGPGRDDDEPTPFEPPRGSAYYRWVADAGRQAAEALAHAHRNGVIHRDVKPSNLLVDAKGAIWMADFGLARRLADPSQTQLDSLLGTPRYMSPEQARTGPIDGRTDVYSLGATLYELLTLRPPFEGRTAAELIDQIGGRDPAPLRQFDRRVPRDLETIVLKALQKRPADRYETAAELAEDLERFLNTEPVRARRIGPIGRAWRVARRYPSLTIVSAAATLAVVASSTIAYVRVVEERNEARKARNDYRDVAVKLESANGQTREAMRSLLVRNAAVVRTSAASDRRATGLELLRQAAALSPRADRRTDLRDEAVALLAIRDVEKRPEIPTADRVGGLAFGDDGVHLASLSEDGGTVRFWDVGSRAQVGSHDLAGTAPSPSPSPTTPPRGRSEGGPGPRANPGRSWSPWPRIAGAGPDVAVIHPDGRGVRLLDAATGAVSGDLRLFDHPSPRVGPPDPLAGREIVGLIASADGRRLVTVDRAADADPPRGRSGRPDSPAFGVHLWDASSPCRPLASLYEPRPEARPEFFGRRPLVAIAPDGATVAVAEMGDSEIALWTKDGKPRDTIDSQARLTAVALGPGGLLAAAGNRAVLLWDLDNPAAGAPGSTWLAALTPNQAFVDGLRFSADDGTLLAVSGGWGSGIEIWDVPASARVATIPSADQWHGLSVAPGGGTVAVGGASSLSLYSVVNPLARTQIAGFKDRLEALAFAPDGELAMLSRDRSLRRWSAGTSAVSPRPVGAPASAVAYDATGRLIVQERDRVAWLPPAGRPGPVPGPSARLPELGRQAGDRWKASAPPASASIARTPDGRTIVMTRLQDVFLARVGPDGTPGPVVRLDGLDLGPPDPSLPGRRPESPSGPGPGPGPGERGRDRGPRGLRVFRDVAVSPAGDRVYLRSFPADEVSAWSLRGDRLDPLPWASPGPASRIALSPDGATLAVGERSGSVRLLDAETGAVRSSLTPPEGDPDAPVESLAFAPGGGELAVGTSQQVRLWSLTEPSPRPFVRLIGHRGTVTALAYSLDGSRLASGGDDKTVDVWDLGRVRDGLARHGLD